MSEPLLSQPLLRDRLPYSGLTLDRGGRADDARLAAQRADPSARTLPMWRGDCLTSGGEVVWLPGGDGAYLGAADRPVFTVDLSDLPESDAIAMAGADAVTSVRSLFGAVSAEDSATLAYARGLHHWHRTHRFCGACGAATRHTQGGHVLVCDGCERPHFPRIEPAVIVLVTAPGPRCLLGRHRGSTGWSTLAGFVEIGESLEDAVRREVREEAGVRVGSVRYLGSQGWPFPAGIMLGFHADAEDDHIAVDLDELDDARWFTPAEVIASRQGNGGRSDSIEDVLVREWTTLHQP